VARAVDRYASFPVPWFCHATDDAALEVRDEHRQDYDPGRGGWGAQAQRIEIERRRQVEERYADVEQGAPVAIGGEEWQQVHAVPSEPVLKRARSPDDEDEGSRQRPRVDEDTGRM
jgi:nuclear cap-binding protein subunit 2